MNKQEIYNQFVQYVSDERRRKIESIAKCRTKHITIVLEDIYQSHNISAVLRSCEAFGIDDVYIIEQLHKFSINENVVKGATKWLNLNRFRNKDVNNTKICFDRLRNLGYKIVATTPHENDMPIDQLPLNEKIALVFGTEQYGLTPFALENADMFVKIPMYGFTQSFNISVAAAICLYETTKRLRESNVKWQLTDEQILDLKLKWVGKSTNLYSKINDLIIANAI